MDNSDKLKFGADRISPYKKLTLAEELLNSTVDNLNKFIDKFGDKISHEDYVKIVLIAIIGFAYFNLKSISLIDGNNYESIDQDLMQFNLCMFISLVIDKTKKYLNIKKITFEFTTNESGQEICKTTITNSVTKNDEQHEFKLSEIK